MIVDGYSQASQQSQVNAHDVLLICVPRAYVPGIGALHCGVCILILQTPAVSLPEQRSVRVKRGYLRR